ncbi:MAG: ribonuclease HII [Bacteroidetes bacterium]|jgi:ribonuclease HII|nr:ribonuclease HII [Bacteroidota bacterium]
MLRLAIQENRIEAGCDEAGRGCIAGPVCAAAVILPEKHGIVGLNDSKKLSKSKRDKLRSQIEKKAIAWSVAMVWEKEIDQINILNASIKAMHIALDGLEAKPEFIAVDGNRFKPYATIPHETIIKGDGKYLHIAAASVLAKTHRDAYMKDLHENFPEYNWQKNKGYPTVEHRIAVIQFGLTQHHRKSFKTTDPQLKLWTKEKSS